MFFYCHIQKRILQQNIEYHIIIKIATGEYEVLRLIICPDDLYWSKSNQTNYVKLK